MVSVSRDLISRRTALVMLMGIEDFFRGIESAVFIGPHRLQTAGCSFVHVMYMYSFLPGLAKYHL
jgi:hypothetical protein